MKVLLLVRHAKSSHDDPCLPDRERPLNDRGLKDAPKMARRLLQRGLKVGLIVSSPALRALTTAQLMAAELGADLRDIVVDERLYAGGVDGLLAAVRDLDPSLRQVMLVGHNPEISELALRLAGEFIDMPTCAVVEFHLDMKSWADIGQTRAAPTMLDLPRR